MNTETAIRRIIIKCPKCERPVRVPLLGDKTLIVKCPGGCGTFNFDCGRYITKIAKQPSARNRSTVFIVSLLCVVITLPFILWELAQNRVQSAKQDHERNLAQLDADLSTERERLKAEYAAAVAAIDSSKLAKQAKDHYAVEWKARQNYSPQYALSARERALLAMQALARDPTKGEREIIREIAAKVAPKNSRVAVSETNLGFRLDVDFDMSELTAGEIGTTTKHSTVDSLKKEVVRLISQVLNDVYQFCEALELKVISIGCKHLVRQYDENRSYIGDSNIVLYKVRLGASELGEMKHNPFLDTYSITQRFKVEFDDFPNLSITESRYEK